MSESLTIASELAQRIDGWLTLEEGELLFKLASRCNGNGVIVEIGSWKGRSTTWLAHGTRSANNVPVYAIDPHRGSVEHERNDGEDSTLPEFLRNMEFAGVQDIVHPVVATSFEVAEEFSEPVALIFCDSAHNYQDAKAEFDAWFPKVIPGGIVVLNNTMVYPGPTRVATEEMYRSRDFRDVRFVRGMTYGEKVERNTSAEYFRNQYGLMMRRSYKRASEAKLPAPARAAGRRFARLVQ